MNIFLAVVILVAFIVFIAVAKRYSPDKISRREYHYQHKEFFMTRAEHEFYNALDLAVGDRYRIFAQVHLPTIVDHKVRNGQNWRGAFRHIDEKSVDFVLCDKEFLKPVLAIELDDKSHDEGSRKNRDNDVECILQQAEMPLLRIENHGSFDSADVSRRISEKLGEASAT